MGVIEELYEEYRQTHLQNGGKEQDFAFACRERRDGDWLPLVIDLSTWRAMDEEQLEEELEDMQNDLDDTVDALEEFEAKHGHPAFYSGDVLEEHEELLDERFAVEFYIAQIMKLL